MQNHKGHLPVTGTPSAQSLAEAEHFDSVLYALGAASALSATITIELHTPLSGADITALATAIEAPGLRYVGPRTVEVVGNTKAAQLTVRVEIAGESK
ncbi:hypothetical protein [Streptomyces hydrogenans]|uniref:hypothetical protein n=1 Tax=Streptomyces hydrogenans TaxID=1873719 RepID=UPI003813D981